MSLTYSASTDKTTIASTAALTNLAACTAISWVKLTATGISTEGRIFQKGTFPENAGAFCYFTNRASGGIGFEINRSGGGVIVRSTLSILTADIWQYIAGVYDTAGINTDQRLYLGSLTSLAAETGYITQTVGSGTITTNSGANLTLGNKNNNAQQLNGDLGLVMIFNRKLSIEEIRYLQFNPVPISGCVYFGLPGSNGTSTQPDYSGNGHSSSAVASAGVTANPPIRFGRHLDFNPYAVTVVPSSRMPKPMLYNAYNRPVAYYQ